MAVLSSKLFDVSPNRAHWLSAFRGSLPSFLSSQHSHSLPPPPPLENPNPSSTKEILSQFNSLQTQLFEAVTELQEILDLQDAKQKLAREIKSKDSSLLAFANKLKEAERVLDMLVDDYSDYRKPKRTKTVTESGSGYSPLNDPSPNWSNRPPKETILLDGCDYEHWLIVMEFDDPKPTEDEMINAYVKTLTSVVGSEEEAKKKIYSVSTSTYTGFGALISEELSCKVKGLPGVLWVLPDSYLDVPNKDYGGDLYIEGKVIPRPQYRFTDQRQTRNRSRPRYDRRRETMQVERREPTQKNWNQNQPPSSMGHQAPEN